MKPWRSRGQRLLPTLCFLSISISCTDLGTAPDLGRQADHSSIADPQKRWEAYAMEDYSMLQSRDCFCVDGGKRFLIGVRSGRIVSIIDPSDWTILAPDRREAYKTIPDLFALISSIDTTKVASFQVSYDARYGYPLRVFVDPSRQIADEEYGFETAIVQ